VTSGHPGDVVKWLNTEVCKTSIHRFESGRRLHFVNVKPAFGPVFRVRFGPAKARTTAALIVDEAQLSAARHGSILMIPVPRHGLART
jgi:hypothetical protein